MARAAVQEHIAALNERKSKSARKEELLYVSPSGQVGVHDAGPASVAKPALGVDIKLLGMPSVGRGVLFGQQEGRAAASTEADIAAINEGQKRKPETNLVRSRPEYFFPL